LHSAPPAIALPARHLTAQAFAPFGAVVERAPQGRQRPINDGTCVRHHDLARPVADAPGALGLSLFEARATPFPVRLRLLERHRRGSQAFAPFGNSLRMLVVVAAEHHHAADLRPEHLAAFVTDGHQGIHLRPGNWHHPLLSVEAGCWLVVDRIADDADVEEVPIVAWNLEVAGIGRSG
jgi:ureidoglycolate lyase